MRRACDEIAARLPEDPELRAELLERIRTAPPRARFAAAWALSRVERPSLRMLPALLDALADPDGDVRWAAVQLLVDLGRLQGEVLPVLLHAAGVEGASPRRRMALYALRELAPDDPRTHARVREALDDHDPELRRAALSSVAKLAETDPEWTERALSALAHEADPRMRRIATVVVASLAARHPESAAACRAALEEATRSPDPLLARSAAQALARL
jgi:HEAT repeat protein